MTHQEDGGVHSPRQEEAEVLKRRAPVEPRGRHTGPDREGCRPQKNPNVTVATSH